MNNLNLRNLTNSFQDVKLVSLSSWRAAAEISPRDRGGPYVVIQEGYDPEDMKMIAEEFVLGRSGQWLSMGLFYKMPVADRRSEYIFGTAAEVMQLMQNLPSKAAVRRGKGAPEETPASEPDEMTAAIQAGRQQAAQSER